MPIEKHADSHLDHSLTAPHVDFILERFKDRDGFFIETVELPENLESLPSGIWGPSAGDPPVAEEDVFYKVRGTRKCATRAVRRPSRPSRLMTVIAGPHDGRPCVLFTAYGGPCAPREPGDPGISSWDDIVKARAFWAEHALSEDV